MKSEEDRLLEIRNRIDSLDIEIQNLLNERASLAQEVAHIKLAAGAEPKFYRPEREIQVLRRVKERQDGPLSKEEMARLFREVMSACLALEQPMQIAFLGPEGTFTQAAALKHFGHSVATVSKKSISEVFREVESGHADYGVVPVENSTEGVINHTLDQLVESPLKICGEVALRIHHHLMGINDQQNLADIKSIYAHAQTLAQCRQWLNLHLAHVELVEVSSNAEAALLVKDRGEGHLAIAGEMAAEIYGLTIIERNVEDCPDNTTRFLILGTESIPASGDDKTVLLISAKNRPGALFHLLEPLARENISMSRIESRPARHGVWEYHFFVDLDGHSSEEKIGKVLCELDTNSCMFNVLGSFPKAVL